MNVGDTRSFLTPISDHIDSFLMATTSTGSAQVKTTLQLPGPARNLQSAGDSADNLLSAMKTT